MKIVVTEITLTYGSGGNFDTRIDLSLSIGGDARVPTGNRVRLSG